MSKKNKVVYSDIQPNTKEAGVWVNTTDGNVMVEKDGKWVDDSGSSNGSEDVAYFDARYCWGSSNEALNPLSLASEVKYLNGADYVIIGLPFTDPIGFAYNGLAPITEKLLAIKVDYNAPSYVGYYNEPMCTLRERIEKYGLPETFNYLIPITKEQFYDPTWGIEPPSTSD